MLICPKCRTTYSASLAGTCYRDGEKLADYDAFVAAESDPMRGTMIGGKFRIVDRVGQGGMGTVYRAVQAGLNRHVAVKILKRELNVDRDTVARFQREANAMSLLTHPNTVRVYDFGQTEDGLLYLVMELLEGELITQKLSREGALDVLEAVRITQQILRSLAEAHTKNIVHRDLKPDNIFVARVEGHDEPVIKVLDFGIAKIVAPDRRVDQFETQAGTVFGTPRYMSPEQAQGAQLDGRSDLYSVGTLLYQMLTGRAPFVDDDAVVVMAKHIREMPDAPRRAAPDRPIPKSLEDVVMLALAKEPSARYQDAAAFDAALEACVADVIAERQNPTGPRQSLAPEPHRMRVLAVLAAAMLGLGYVGYRAIAPAESKATAVAAQPLEPSNTPALPTPELPKPVVAPSTAAQPEPAVPAHVTLRSRPGGALVYREGKRIGVTPLEMVVRPDEQIVRIELRLTGYQPLAAELTARDGERVLELSPVPLPRRKVFVQKPRAKAPAEGASGESTSEAPNAAAEKKPAGPYERFE